MSEEEKTEAAPEGPKVVTEISIQALDNGEVSVTMPQGSNVWILRGIIVKALQAVCNLEIK